jgi:hypothetical protein
MVEKKTSIVYQEKVNILKSKKRIFFETRSSKLYALLRRGDFWL